MSRCRDAAEAVAAIQSGQRVFIHGASARLRRDQLPELRRRTTMFDLDENAGYVVENALREGMGSRRGGLRLRA